MPYSFGSLDGQVALITGGAGGLGSEAALWLAVAGAQVVIADVNAAALERAEIRLTEKRPDAKSFHYAALDVTDSAAVRDLVADIGSRHGRLDILLTSHGFPASGQTARIVTVTVDRLAFSLSPPLVSAIVAFEQGGRLQVELTDVRQPPGVGDEVAPTFRRGATVGGIRNYIWKARPVYPTTSVVPASARTERES